MASLRSAPRLAKFHPMVTTKEVAYATIVRRAPSTIEELRGCRGIGSGTVATFGEAMLEALEPHLLALHAQGNGRREAERVADRQQAAKAAVEAKATVAAKARAKAQAEAKAQLTANELKGRLYLNVHFLDKDLVKQRGARWDGHAKRWYVPSGILLDQFAHWLPK